MAKKSICHVTSVHNWDDIRIFKKQCVSLAKYFDKVHLVAPNGPNGTFNGVNVTCVENKYKGRIKRILYFRKQIINAALKLDADIYQFHDPELLSFVSYFKRKGKIVIYDSHEDVPETILTKKWIPSKMIRKVISSIFDRFEKRTVSKCDGLISVLPGITEKFNCKHSETIYNFPLVDEVENIYKTYNTSDPFRIVYNGGLTEIRGLEQICLAFNLLKDKGYELHLMGKWESEEFKQKCLGQAQFTSKIHDYGMISYEECQKHLKNAHLGIIAFHPVKNHVYSLPNKSFEYIMNGLPMVISNFEFWKKEFKEVAKFADPLNPQEIADAIEDVRLNYDSFIQKTISFRDKVVKEQSWASQEEKLVAFYKEIIG